MPARKKKPTATKTPPKAVSKPVAKVVDAIKVKPGRPTSFSQPLLDQICEQLAEGIPLREICRRESMPAWRTVYDWMDQNETISARIARAREVGHDAIAEQALNIADTPIEGIRTKVGKDGTEITTEDMLGHRKLQIETRLKLLAKWNPKKYGDKLEVKTESKFIPLSELAEKIAARERGEE